MKRCFFLLLVSLLLPHLTSCKSILPLICSDNDASPISESEVTYLELETLTSSSEFAFFEPTTFESELASQADLYKIAQELSEQYRLSIYIEEQCPTTFTEFSTKEISDYETVLDGLSMLRLALSCYPDDFFEQLYYGTIDSIEIYLTGTLKPTNSFDNSDSYAAFVETNSHKHMVVVDITLAQLNTYFHEFSHIIDQKLQYESNQRKDCVFSETGWLSLSPNGFSYLYTYSDLPKDFLGEGFENYFIDAYSQINPTEDRARIMEYAMNQNIQAFKNAEGLQNKLLYYSTCIRNYFDTTDWPETTLWEQVLLECNLWP